ncbi:glycosyltransferase family 4 protein, partial [candidate division KSB1 bacterium]|nr:glycosyltransferase family 4 protein [candidate division KSB1 bacterium]
VGVSQYYTNAIQEKMNLPPEKLHTVYLGIDTTGYQPAQPDEHAPVIGYLSRITEPHGLDVLLDAFIPLKNRLPRVKLHVTGGHTADDRAFVKKIQSTIAEHNLENDVKFYPDFNKESRINFLQQLSVMSVPMVCGEAFGMYLLEGLMAGVPFVQPNCGAYPELAKITGGGIVFNREDTGSLVDALYALLNNPKKLHQMGAKGRQVVKEKFNVQVMAENMVRVYKGLLKRK